MTDNQLSDMATINESASCPTAWIMCGISGSGKTTYARSLESGRCVRLSVDEEMWRRYGPSCADLPADMQQKASAEVERHILLEMKRLLREGYSVAVDSCMCKRAKRDIFASAAREAGGDPRLVYLKADYDTLSRRLSEREGRLSANTLPVSDMMLRKFLQGFEPPEADEPHLLIEQS